MLDNRFEHAYYHRSVVDLDQESRDGMPVRRNVGSTECRFARCPDSRLLGKDFS